MTGQSQSGADARPVIGLIGAGDMGAAIATSILRHLPLVAFDVRPEPVQELVGKGATAAGSLAALADQCDIAILVVVNDAQVKTVVGELFRHKGRLRSIVVSATILPKTMVELKEEADRLGLDLIDAPVSGGAEKASRGTITILIGGDEDAVKRAWPLFESFGGNIFHLGPIGAGSAGKLVNNLLSMGGNILILEAMQLAGCYGISEDRVTEFVSVSAGGSRGLNTWGRVDRARAMYGRMGDGVYELFAKDVKTAAIAAGHTGATLPVASVIGALMGERMKTRDAQIAARGGLPEIPRCTVCGQELALPFRKAGAHVECLAMDADKANW
jgi:3-hydroxyisobutyrate dehydrogenase